MPLFGRIVVIKRNGTDGTHFPLTANSCLFGRKKECDIRIQLPQVSKEHCKIEINENKEATLINLSAVNPTQLNGSNFQHPTCLKHKDILTIIDRSFRFEYPPLLSQRKRHSTSQEKETLQVLHIQQVDQEELLHPQSSECKNLQTPDKKLEWEGQNTHGSDKQKTEERITRQYGTPESILKTRRSNRKNEMSPFSQLYYLMKNEEERQTAKEDLNNEIPAQQKEYLLMKDGNDCLAEITTQTPHRRSANKKAEVVIQEEVEQSREIENEGLKSVVCSLVSFKGNKSRKSSVSLQTYATEKKLGSEETTDQVHLQDIKKNELEKSEVFKSDVSLRANKQNAEDITKSCCIVSLEYSNGAKSIEQPTEATDVKISYSLTNTFEFENSLPTSKSKGKSIQVFANPDSREGSRSSSKSRTLPAEVNSLLDIFSPTESSVETESSSVHINREERVSGIFNPNIHSEIKENSASVVIEQPLDPEILKETKNYICSSDTYNDGNSGITACSPCRRRSPRRSMKQNKDFASECYFKEMLTEKVSLETPTSVSPGSDSLRTPNQLSEQAVGVKKPPQKRKDREVDLLDQPFRKRKRVSFGGHLSPELFDKRLPPNSPLKRGAIPARLSLPFGNSPRAVLKKTSKLGLSLNKDLSETKQHENALPKKAASPPARRSPAASPPARRSPAASPPARRSPAASPPARRSPAASPPARRSPAASPTSDFPCNLPQRRGRFSVSLITSSSSSVEQETTTGEKYATEDFTEAKTLEISEHEFESPQTTKRSKTFALKRNSLHGRSVAMDAIHSKQQSGASGANLIVATSWAEVEKQGSPKSPLKMTTKCDLKRPAEKITSKLPKDFSEMKQHETTSPRKAASPPARRSLALRLPADSPSSTITGEKHIHEDFTEAKSLKPSEHEYKTPQTIRRSKNFALKRNSLHRRSGAMDGIHSKRRSGASGANLIVAKSWAEVVKQGVPKSHLRITSKCGLKKPAKKIKTSKRPKSYVAKTPARKVKDYFTTGHANSPAPIVIGKAHTNIVKIAAQAPKVMLNYHVKQHCNLNESFTGVADIFNTPLNWKQKNSMSSVEKTNMSTPEVSVLHTSENSVQVYCPNCGTGRYPQRYSCSPKRNKVKAHPGACPITNMSSGEMTVPSFTTSSQQRCNQDASPLPQMPSLVEDRLMVSPRGGNTEEGIEEIVKGRSSLGTAENETLVGVPVTRKRAKQKSESEVFSGIKRLMRTPRQKPEPVEALSGVKRLMRTPRQKPEPVEALSGVKRLMRTPRQKPEPVEALSGVKRLMRTPKKKPEPIEVLSGVKRLMRTPKEKPEPVEALSDVMREKVNVEPFEDEKPEPVEALSEVKGLMITPKEKPEPVEALSGVKRLMRTPKEKPEPVEALSDVMREKVNVEPFEDEKPEPVEALSEVKGLMRTPKEKPEPVDALSGVKRLMRTPKEKPEPVEALSDVMRENVDVELFEDEKPEPVEALSEVKRLMRTPKEKPKPIEALSGVMREKFNVEPFEDESVCSIVVETPEVLKELQGNVTKRTPKQRAQSVGNTGISYIIETPKEKVQPIENTEEIPTLPKTPKQRFETVEEIVGISRLSKTPRQMFQPVDDYLGLQKLMAEPKQSYFSPEIDYTGIKETLDTAKEYKVKLQESANLMEEQESHILSRSALEFSESMPENEEFQQETKLKVLFERESYLAKPKDNSKNDPKVEDNLGHLAFGSLNEFKMETGVGSIEIECVPENSQPVGMDLQNGTIIDSVKSAKQESSGVIDPELFQPLASTRQTRGGKGDRSSSTEEPNTKKTQSCTGNTLSAKSANSMQTNESSDQNVTEPRPVKKSEMTKRVTRGKSRQHSAERNTDMESDNVMQTPELSEETSVKMQQSVKRWVAAKGHGQAEAGLNLKETAAAKENGSRLITKTSLRSRNRKDDKNELKSEFTKINPHDKMQCKDLEHSEMELVRNDVFKRNTRGKRGNPIQTHTEKGKLGNLELITQETRGKESSERNPTKVQENIMRKGKGRKVHFLLENSAPLKEKCMIGDENVAHEEKDNAFFESSATSTKEMTLRRSKRKAPAASLPVYASSTRKHVLTEKCEVEQKEGKNLPLEHISLVKDNSSGSSGFAQEKCSQEIQNKDNPNEILENVPTPIDQSPSKQRKVTKKKPLERGRSKQAISHEISTEYDYQAADTEDQKMPIAVEIPSKRGRGRRVAPVTQVSLPLENILAKENPSMDNLSFTKTKCSLQYIKNEENPTETQNVSLKNEQAPVDYSAHKKQQVTQDYQLRRGRSKHTISHETATKYDNKESTDIKDQNMVVKNAFSTKENPSKRGRKRRVAPISQTLFSPLKNDNLHLPSSPNCQSTEDYNKGLETVELAPANGSLSLRGRRRKTDIPIASSVSTRKRSRLLDNDNQEKVPEDLQSMTKVNVCKRGRRNLAPYESSAGNSGQPGNVSKEATPVKEKVPLENGFGKENQPKRSQRKNNFLASQVPPSLKVSITLPSVPSDKGRTASEDQSMLIRNAVGEEKVANSEQNDKRMLCSRTARRRCKLPEEIFQEKQKVDLEKTEVSNEKQSRKGRRKIDAEATVSVSVKEKCRSTVRGGTISKDQHVILENTISDLKGALKGTQRKVCKEEILCKNTDSINISNSKQDSNLGLQVLPEKGNPSKRGKQKRVNSEPESSVATSDMKKTFFTENKSSKATSGNTESTTLQRGRKKMKEYYTTVVIQPTVEMESKTRASRRTRK